MPLSVFLSHQWLSFWRGRNAGKSIALQIIVGVFYFLIFLDIAAIGILLPYLLEESMPGKEPVAIFTSYILYYFLVGLLARFQLQELPSLSIQPYLTQNIRRKNILLFLNARSLVHVINFLPLFVYIPFTLVTIVPVFGIIAATCFLIAMFALVINNHFLTMYIKRKTVNNSWFFLAALLFIAALKGLDYLKVLLFEKASSSLFISLLNYPVFCLLPVGLALAMFVVNNNYLRNHLYIEDLVSEKKLKLGKNYAFLDWLGDVGEMIALEMKLIFRNKRPRSMLILSGVFLLYGFMVYPIYLKTENFTALFIFALLITGLFISNYGAFLFSWQSSHFDGLMSYHINMKQYIKAKFTLLVTVCAIQFLLACFYGLMSWRLLPLQLAAFLYNAGVNAFFTIYAATYNYKYINITKSAALNYQGIGAMQWLQSLLMLIGPGVAFYLLNILTGFWGAVIAISALGIIGLALNEMIINWLVGQFNNRKHKILEGFRQH